MQIFIFFIILSLSIAKRIDKHPLFHFLPHHTYLSLENHVNGVVDKDVSNFQQISAKFSSKTACSTPRCGGNPLVIIPSLIGNQLDAKLHRKSVPHFWCYKNAAEYKLWIDLLNFIPHSPTQSCMWSNMNITFVKPGEYQHAFGVNVTAPYFGGVDGVKFLDSKKDGKVAVWNTTVEVLKENFNYIPGKDIRAATFDWREGPDATNNQFPQIKQLIEETYAMANNQKVALVSLSMGGPRAARFLMSQPKSWKDKYISTYTSFSGAFGGSLWATVAQLSKNAVLYKGIPLNADEMHSAVKGFGSVAYMWPNRFIYNDSTPYASMDSKSYTSSDFIELAKDASSVYGQQGAAMLKTVSQAKYQDFQDIDVKSSCVYGTEQDTPSFLQYTNGDWTNPNITFTKSGDSTLLLPGLIDPCKKWKSQLVPISGMKHGQDVINPIALKVLFGNMGLKV